MRRLTTSLAVTALIGAGTMTVPVTAIADSSIEDGIVSIYPDEFKGAIKNPLMGFSGKDFRVNTTGPTGSSDQPLDHLPWATTMMTYIPWDYLENDESDGLDKITNYLDERWRGKDSDGVWRSYEELGIKAIPRVYLRFPSDTDYFGLGGDHWPADLRAGDFTSPQFDERLERMIKRLADVWDNDDRVAYIQMGIFGTWGEQHGTAQPANIEKYFNEYFHNKHVQVRYVDNGQWKDSDQFGHYNDSIGNLNVASNWATKPIGGEPAYDYNGFDIQGTLVHETYLDEDLNSNSANMIRFTHANYLTWIGEYTYGSSWGNRGPNGREVYLANKATIDDRAEFIQSQFGYRYVMEEFQYPEQISPGENFDVSFTVRNEGASPMYYNWPVEISLCDPDSKEVVWRDTFKNVDITKWQPGTDLPAWNKRKDGNWSNGVLDYATPPESHTETGTFTLPGDLAKKDYVVQLAVLDPGGNVPSLRFSMQNYTQGGYHPMGYVGVGNPPEKVNIDPSTFDSPAVDVGLRYYTDGKTHYDSTVLASLELKEGNPVRLAEGGRPFDLRNLRLFGKDSGGMVHVLDAATPSWSITEGNDHVALEGSILTPRSAGDVLVTATFNGIASAPFKINISDEVGDITGIVKDHLGTPLIDAKVSAKSDGDAFETSTDTAGTFTFHDLPVGTYQVRATRENYAGEPIAVKVEKGQSANTNISLRLATGGDFFDDFEDGASEWTPGRGAWTSTDGKYTQTTIGGSSPWQYGSTITGKIWQDAIYETDISYTRNANWGGLLFRKQAQTHTINNSGYAVLWNENGKIEIDRAGSTVTTLASIVRQTDWSTSHHLKVVNIGANIKVYVDNETDPILEVDDTAYAHGYAGVGANGSIWSFDNVKVTDLFETPSDMSMKIATRCVAGNVVLAVSVTNLSEKPADITISTPYGSKTLTNVASEATQSAAFSSRRAQIPQGKVEATSSLEGEKTPISEGFDAAVCN